MSNMSDKKNSIKNNMIYSTVGSITYFTCQWLLLVLIVWLADYSKAGILSLATSVTASPAIIALYSVRNYQVSDIDGKYSNNIYFVSRIVSSLMSLIVCLIMIFIGGYGMYKSLVILTYMFFKIVEAFADYYYGLEQKFDRMDYSGISMVIRGIGTLIIFVISYLILKDLLISLIIMTIFSALIIVIYDVKVTRNHYGTSRFGGEWKEIKQLMIECFPLALVAYLNNFAIMIPRLFLEHYYGDELMGYYSSVASPTSVIQLLATSLFAPLIVSLTIHFNNKNKKAFISIIYKFLLASLVVSIVGIIAAKLLGEWVLVLLFRPEIKPYVYLFIPVIIMTIFMALNSCFFSICTLMRIMKEQYLRGAIGVLSSLVASVILVKKYDCMGVVYASLIAIMLQMVLQISVILKRLNFEEEENYDIV